jgi:hypothetical protein
VFFRRSPFWDESKKCIENLFLKAIAMANSISIAMANSISISISISKTISNF